MKASARAVVIGGGVVGASVLYHLAKIGWSDVLLLEKSELTSGSTWHAAGGMHTVNGDPNVAKLQQYTINLYKEIEQISGQSCGVHITGVSRFSSFERGKNQRGVALRSGFVAQVVRPAVFRRRMAPPCRRAR